MRRPTQIVLALSTMTAASCLITTDPTFDPPPRTAPFFEPDSASPSNLLVFVNKDGVTEETFSGLIQSEDSDSPLLARLYMDYGDPANGDSVFFDQVVSAEGLSASSWDEAGRRISVTWRRSNFTLTDDPEERNTLGCHRFTLMVVHDGFDGRGCPLEPGDFATITWLVQNCETGDCSAPAEAFNPISCPPFDQQAACPPRPGAPENTGGSQ